MIVKTMSTAAIFRETLISNLVPAFFPAVDVVESDNDSYPFDSATFYLDVEKTKPALILRGTAATQVTYFYINNAGVEQTVQAVGNQISTSTLSFAAEDSRYFGFVTNFASGNFSSSSLALIFAVDADGHTVLLTASGASAKTVSAVAPGYRDNPTVADGAYTLRDVAYASPMTVLVPLVYNDTVTASIIPNWFYVNQTSFPLSNNTRTLGTLVFNDVEFDYLFQFAVKRTAD